MHNNPEPPRVHSDLLGADADPALARLVSDLDTLYTAAEPPAFSAMLRDRIDSHRAGQASGAPGRKAARPAATAAPGVPALRFRLLRRRPLIALATAAVLGAVAVTGIIAIDGGTRPVSAEAILTRAVEAANPATAGARTYRRTGTSTTTAPEKAQNLSEQIWYGGNGRVRIESQVTNAAGLTESSGTIINGDRQWTFREANGRTYYTVLSLGANLRPAIDQKFSPGSDAAALSDVIAQYRGDGCSNVQQQADTRVANRAAYVIAVTPAVTGGRCSTSVDKGGRQVARTVIAVDKETFFPLRMQLLDAAGGVVCAWETTSIEYNVAIPDSTFTYTPPPGAIIETEDATARPGSKDPTQADKEKIDRLRKAQEAQQRPPTPTATPRP